MSKQFITADELQLIIENSFEKLKNQIDSSLTQKRVFNRKDLMDYTGYSCKNIYRLTSLKLIPFSKPTNGSLFFDRLKIEEWLLRNDSPTNQEVTDLVDNHLYKNKKA